MTAPAPSHAHLAVYDALRLKIKEALKIKASDIGGWAQKPDRTISIAVYGYGGEFTIKPGMVGSDDNLAVQVSLRGTQVLTEREAMPLRDALRHLVDTFTHPLIAGANIRSWEFEIVGDGMFDSLLTLKGKLSFRTRPHQFETEAVIGMAQAVLLEWVRQHGQGEDEEP